MAIYPITAMTFGGNEYQFRDDAAGDNIVDLRATIM